MPLGLLLAAVGLQLLIGVARLEAWRLCLQAAGAPLPRRLIYAAGAVALPVGVINCQLAAAARIAILRRLAPNQAPGVATLAAAEIPVWAGEALVGLVPLSLAFKALGMPVWVPLGAIAIGFCCWQLAPRVQRRFAEHKLLAGMRILGDSDRRARLIGWLAVITGAQIARIWLLLTAAGIAASPYQASAVLVGQGALSQLPLGPTSTSGVSMIVFGDQGVHNAAAAGIGLTATDFLGGLLFLGLVAAVLSSRRLRASLRALRG
jgi:hypothetical protein